MKNIFSLVFILLLLVTNIVVAAGDISLTDIVQPTSVKPGETATGKFKVSSLTNLNIVIFVKNDLILAGSSTTKIDAGVISFTPNSLSNVGTTPQQVNVNVNVPQFTPVGTYQGAIEVTDTGSNSQSFTLVVTVSPDPKLELVGLSDTVPLIVTGREDQSKVASFNIKNTGNVDLNNLAVSGFSITDDDGESANVVFTNIPTNVKPNSQATFNLKVDIPRNFDLGKYTTTFNVKDSVANVAKDVKLELRIQPEICTDGIVSDGQAGGNNIVISVKEPDSGDNFKIGDIIKIEADVKNNDNDDMDVILEAILYNIDQAEEVESVTSDPKDIRNGREEDFDIELEVPSDEIDQDDQYVLYIKAYEEDNEDENCNEADVNVDLKLEDHRVIIDELKFVPASGLTCGDTFDVIVDTVNVGSKDQDDVFVKLVQSALKFDLIGGNFDLEDANSDDNEQTVRFNDLVIPSNSNAKSYQFEAIVTYKDGDKTESEFATLSVASCTTGGATVGGSVKKQAELNLPTNKFSVRKGDAISLPILVTNNGQSTEIFSVEVVNVGNFASSVPSKSVSLGAGESTTMYFVLTVKNDAASGAFNGVVNVKSGNDVVGSDVFNVDVSGNLITGSVVGSGLSNILSGQQAFWVIGDIVLVIVAIFFLKMIFSSRRKTA